MKKIPMRMCVACREMQPKTQLLRVVRQTDGQIAIDKNGKQNGRGAYLCKNEACLSKALKIRALERALECVLPEQTVLALKEEIEGAGTAV